MNMTSISGTSSSSILKGMSSNKLSGLASGLDTDALIEAMTTTTRSRIAKAQQQKQLTSWKMDAFRSISSKLISFQNKYTSMSSSSALRSASFFSKSVITPSGAGSQYVKVTGNGNNAENVSIAAVKQLAKNASYVTPAGQNAVLQAGEAINTDYVDTSRIAGESITFKYGVKDITVSLGSDVYESIDGVAQALQDKLKGTDLEGVLTVGAADGKLQFGIAEDATNIASGGVTIKAMGSNMKDIFGFNLDDETEEVLTAAGDKITGTNAVEEKNDLVDSSTSAADALAGKTITFTYNGKSADITFPTENFTMDQVQNELQTQLNKAFGAGRVVVETDTITDAEGNEKKTLRFTTKNPADSSEDYSSVLRVSGDTVAMGVLGLKDGDSNRMNLKAAIGVQSGYEITIADYAGGGEPYVIDKDINGNAFNENTTMEDIIKAINASDAGVKVSYLETTDQLSVTSIYEGASGNFEIGGTLGEKIFGADASGKGQDAIVSVDYGTGDDPVDISRGSNTFDLNGMKVTVSGEFGMKEVQTGVDDQGNPIMEKVIDKTQAVTFDAQVDTEKVTKAVKEMITAYNDIIKLANDMVKEKRNRDYTPLSDEQKEDMTEEEIEKWEKKAKEGVLFNNSELRGFTNEIRFLFSGSGMMNDLSKMGITTSSDYADAGKIIFDEEKFKAALEEDPEKVSKVFAGYTDEDGEFVNGLMDNVKTVFDKYAATDKATKGIFVQMAGAPESSLSMLTNTLQKQLDGFEDTIKTLQDKLEEEAERYYNKFSRLEVYINNMNSQSSWLAQQTGGY